MIDLHRLQQLQDEISALDSQIRERVQEIEVLMKGRIVSRPGVFKHKIRVEKVFPWILHGGAMEIVLYGPLVKPDGTAFPSGKHGTVHYRASSPIGEAKILDLKNLA